MDSVPGVWEAFSRMAELESNTGDFEAFRNFRPQRNSLLPFPLRLRSASPTTTTTTTTTTAAAAAAAIESSTTPATSRPQVNSPPASPSSTVFVSLREVGGTSLAATQVSLHEYRKNLSSPQIGSSPGETLPRTLKRKPKEIDLNRPHRERASPSPPPTPSSSSSAASLLCEPETPVCSSPEPECRQRYQPSSLIDNSRRPAATTITEQWLSCRRGNELYNDTEESATRQYQQKRPKAFRDYLRQLHSRFTHHSKASSDSTLNSRPAKSVLRHRGVSFEILNPRNGPINSPSQVNKKYPARTIPSNHSAANMSSPCLTRTATPTRTSRLEVAARRPTPPRAIFDDLPTAHSSITSRIGTSDGDRRACSLPESDDQPVDRENCHPRTKNHLFQVFNDGSIPNISHSTSTRQHPAALTEYNTHFGTSPSGPLPINFSDGMEQSQSIASREGLRGKLQGIRGRKSGQNRQRARLVKKPRKSKPGKQGTKSFCHSSPVCLRVRPILSEFLNRRQPSLHAVRGRIEKPHKKATIRRRPNSVVRHANVIDGFLYDPYRMIEFPEAIVPLHVADLESKKEDQKKEELKAPSCPYFRAKPAVSCPDLPATQPRVALNSARPRLRNGGLPKLSISTPNFSRLIETDVSPLPESCAGSPTESPVFPLSAHLGTYHDLQPNDFNRIHNENDGTSNHCPDYATQQERSQSDDVPSDNEITELSILDDYYFNETSDSLEMGVQDPGPGSSQTTSTAMLSEHTLSSSVLQPQMHPPTATLPRSVESYPFSTSSSEVSASYANRDSYRDVHTARPNSDIRSSCPTDNEREESDWDWETVGGSQQFDNSNRWINHSETGSSVANYSSFGTLTSRDISDPPFSQGMSRPQRTGSPLRNELTSTDDVDTQSYGGSPPASGPDYNHQTGPIPDPVNTTIPPLSASTRNRLAPIPQASSQYIHPPPLENMHNHPFRSTPPPLFSGTNVSSRPNRTKESRTSPISALRSSKLSLHNASPQSEESGLQTFLDEPSDSSDRPSSPSCPSPTSAQEEISYSPIETFCHFSSSQITHGTQHIPNPSKSSISQDHTREEPRADQTSDKDPVSVGLNHATCGSLRASLPPREKRNGSRCESPTRSGSADPLIREPPVRKFAPGSLYLSIRSARNSQPAVSSNRGRSFNRSSRFSLANPTPVRGSMAEVAPAAESELFERQGKPTKAKSVQFSCPPCRASSSYRLSSRGGLSRTESRRRDDAIRERLERLDTAAISDLRPSSPVRPSSRPAALPLRDLPPSIRDSFVIGHRSTVSGTGGTSNLSPTGWDEESTLVPDWYCSSDGRYIFSEPPRLTQGHERRSKQHSTAEYLVTQRRLGRQLILGASLMLPPLSWIIVALIGLGGERSDVLIHWRSRGSVYSFHERERRLARTLSLGFFIVCFLAAVVTAAVMLAG